MGRDRAYLLWAVLPILPFIAGFAVLAVVDAPGAELSAALREIHAEFPVIDGIVQGQVFVSAGREIMFLNALFVYLSMGVFHVAACLGVIGFMAYRIWRMPPLTRRKVAVVLGLSLLILVLANIGARQDGWRGALSLAYRNICDVVLQSGTAAHILPPACTAPGISTFAWLAALPYLMGLLAAAFASAVVSGAILGPVAEAPARVVTVTRAFQSTAFVLVTSMLALVLFYKLPLSVIADGDARALVLDYAQGVTMYWGALFTVTLIAIFGPANLILNRQLRQSPDAAAVAAQGPRAFLDPQTRAQITTALTTLAPLLIGTSGPLLEQIASALSGG